MSLLKGAWHYQAHSAHNIMISFAVTYSLVHVEGEADVLLLGEEQNEEVITCLTLLDGRIQADLLRQHTYDKQRKQRGKEQNK